MFKAYQGLGYWNDTPFQVRQSNVTDRLGRVASEIQRIVNVDRGVGFQALDRFASASGSGSKATTIKAESVQESPQGPGGAVSPEF